jgi:hypothetical protein
LFGCGFLGLFFLFCFFSFGGVDGTTHVYLGDVIVNVDAGWTMCVVGVRLVGLSVRLGHYYVVLVIKGVVMAQLFSRVHLWFNGA